MQTRKENDGLMSSGNLSATLRKLWRSDVLILVVVAAITYLPLIHKLGYTHDDWYLMYAAGAKGSSALQQIFSVDRPGRVLVMIPAYELFGNNALLYNISAFIFRVLGAVALLGILNQLWSQRRVTATVMSLLFLIYPGFLSWPNGIDYQSHIVGLAAALISIWLTLRAVRTAAAMEKIFFHAGSALLGWLYLSQMEWYIGFEFFRWASVFLLCSRLAGDLFKRITRTLQAAYPSLLIPAAFLVWRLFFFVSERGATDVNAQLDLFKLYPVQTLYHWTVQVIQDLFDVMLAAWIIPLSQLMGYIQIWGAIIGIAAAFFIAFSFFSYEDKRGFTDTDHSNMIHEALWLGLFTAAAGLLPIAMVNREVTFPYYSRYSLVSSVGVAIFIVAVLAGIKWRVVSSAVLAVLICSAVWTHHALAVQSAQESAIVQNFWWQVSWRIPQLEPRTTLIGNYPMVAVEEDYFIWGPANLIYYPREQISESLGPVVFAAVLNKETVEKVLARERQEFDNRKNIITYKNYRNILIASQPSLDSCVHVINGLQPEFSDRESASIREIGSFSEVEHVLLNQTSHMPPTIVFGPEPVHDWCYYYQKADLARQRGDWDEVLQMGETAFGKNLAPKDPIEWMPFLQAYAYLGNQEQLKELAPAVRANPYIAEQACQILGSMPDLSETSQDTIHSLYCAE